MLLLGGLVKCIVKRGFEIDHFYLGLEGAFTTMTAALLFVFDLVRRMQERDEALAQAAANRSPPPLIIGGPKNVQSAFLMLGMFLLMGFVMTILMMFFHQAFDKAAGQLGAASASTTPPTDWRRFLPTRRFLVLGLVCNFVGLGLLAGFGVLVQNGV